MWLRFDGENNRGLWEACNSNEHRSSEVQVLSDARAPFCERELYAHGANEDMADFENFEPQNLAGAKEHQQVVAALHATARAFFDGLASAQGDAEATESMKRVDEVIRNDPRETLTRPTGRKKPKPNAPCPCGSGKKYKKCCWSN